MKPRGPLMVEHRLIEKMLKIIGKELAVIKEKRKVNSVFIDTAVDFIRTYADRTHHGKEEDIMFKELDKKEMDDYDKRIMQELCDEHKIARNVVKELVDANDQYKNGIEKSIDTIIEKLTFLLEFYPEHIKKEDEDFFIKTERYFSEEEMEIMLAGYWEFDKRMIHEKYEKLYKELLKRYE